MRALLAEDDRMIGEAVAIALKEASYAVDWVRDGDAACTALLTWVCPGRTALLFFGWPGRAGTLRRFS